MEKFKDDWNEATVLRMLVPKERHSHFIRPALDSSSQMMMCRGGGKCPICETVAKKKTPLVKFFIFTQAVWTAFKELIGRTRC